MSELFRPDGRIMRYGMKFAYLMWLQILTLLCCLPVVTAGAAFTAMHKVLLQIYRDEEGSISGEFFRSFRENFRQATVIWLLFVLVFFTLYLNRRIAAASGDSVIHLAMRYLVPVIFLLAAAGLSWVFVLLSRYRNTVLGTVRMAFIACLAHPLYTVTMMVLMAVPLLLPMLSWRTVPCVILLGFTVPGILRSRMYSRVFDDLEDTDWRKHREEEARESPEE